MIMDYLFARARILFALSLVVGCRSTPVGAPGLEAIADELSVSDSCRLTPEASHASSPSTIRAFPGTSSKIAYIGEGFFGRSLIKEPNRVIVESHEKSRSDGVYHEWTAHRDTTFEVTCVCARHANEFYVYGRNSQSAPVLERWDLSPWPSGGYHTERNAAQSPVGISVRPSDTIVKYSGPFVEPALRTPPVITQTALTAPTLPDEVVEMEVDPEGRFLIFLVKDAQGVAALIRYDIPNASVTTIATAASTPLLQSATGCRFLDSTTEGRLIQAGSGGLYTLYLRDADNDGVFEDSFKLKAGAEHYYALPEFTLTLYP